MIRALRRSDTITAVSLRLLYLIFRQVLGLILLVGRTSSSKDVELLMLQQQCEGGKIDSGSMLNLLRGRDCMYQGP